GVDPVTVLHQLDAAVCTAAAPARRPPRADSASCVAGHMPRAAAGKPVTVAWTGAAHSARRCDARSMPGAPRGPNPPARVAVRAAAGSGWGAIEHLHDKRVPGRAAGAVG